MANWEVKMYHDKAKIEGDLAAGAKYLVNKKNPKSIDVDSDLATYLYDLVDTLEMESLFHVGFGFGQDLVNLHLLYPDMKLGGCELYDLRRAYGQQLFGLADCLVDIIAKEYPYFDIEGYDYIFIGKLLRRSHLGMEIFLKALQQANLGVILFVEEALLEAFEIPEGYVASADIPIDGLVPILVTEEAIVLPDDTVADIKVSEGDILDWEEDE